MTTQKKRISFPAWLPKSIANQAHRILSTPYDSETKRIVELLTTSEAMKTVWEKLSNNTVQPKGTMNLISEILGSLRHWNFMEEEGLLLSQKEKKELMSEITDAIDNLRRVLKKRHLHIWDYDHDTLSPIDMELNSIEQGLEYTFFWKEFPTRIKAGSAKKTFLGRRLIYFMDNQYQKPFDTEIATILSVIFDDEDITDANIRGLRKDYAKIT